MNTVSKSFQKVVFLVCLVFTLGAATPRVFAINPPTGYPTQFNLSTTQTGGYPGTQGIYYWDSRGWYRSGGYFGEQFKLVNGSFVQYTGTGSTFVANVTFTFTSATTGTISGLTVASTPNLTRDITGTGFTPSVPVPWGSEVIQFVSHTCSSTTWVVGSYTWDRVRGWFNGTNGLVVENYGLRHYVNGADVGGATIVFTSTTTAVIDGCFSITGSNFPYVPPTYSATAALYQSWAPDEPVHTVQFKKNGVMVQDFTMVQGQINYGPVAGFSSGDVFSIFDVCSSTEVFSQAFTDANISTSGITLPVCAPPPTNVLHLVIINNSAANAAVSVWSSVQGNIATGAILEPTQQSTSNYVMADGEQVRVIINGVVVWQHTEPTPSVGIEKTLYVGDVPVPDVPDLDSADPENPDPINAPPTNRGDHVATTVDADGTTTHYTQDGDRVIATQTDGTTGEVTSRQVWNGVGADLAPTNATASTIADNQARQIDGDARARDSENLSAIAGAGSGAASGNGNGEAEQSGQDMLENAQQQAGQIPDFNPNTMTSPTPNGSNAWNVFIPGVNQTFNFNPLNVPFFATAASWIRQMIIWLAVFFIVKFALNQFFDFQKAVFAAQQMQGADGGALGGLVSAPVGLVYAAGFILALGAATAIFSAIYLSGAGSGWVSAITSLFQLGGANGGSQMMRAVYELVYAFIPLDHLGNTLLLYVGLLIFKNVSLGVIGITKTLLVR